MFERSGIEGRLAIAQDTHCLTYRDLPITDDPELFRLLERENTNVFQAVQSLSDFVQEEGGSRGGGLGAGRSVGPSPAPSAREDYDGMRV